MDIKNSYGINPKAAFVLNSEAIRKKKKNTKKKHL